MRKNFLNVMGLALLASTILPLSSQAQSPDKEFYLRPSYWRAHDQRGINVFETTKAPDTIPYEGLRMRIGAGFTQEFQSFTHSNTSNVKLYQMGPGFNLAMANLIFDVQLADGIRLDLTAYLSTRHHNETWVKGGYIQFDKLPFKGQFWNDLMKYATIKIGHMEVNYGDQHFRRTDAGNSIYNPFNENLIVDAFSTEIGGEIYLQKDGLFGMIGMTNGTINSSIGKQGKDVGLDSSKKAAVYFKGGVDKSLGKLRVRLTGSAYLNNKSQRNVLYAGDRGGSWYFGVMEPDAADLKANFTSGRFAPNFTRSVQAYMVNAFVKYAGLELMGTYETANGSAYTASDPTRRTMTQTAVEGVYRLGKNENLYVAGRYNLVNAEMPGFTEKVKIDRTSIAGGWFLTRNILLKGEYVWQNYKNFEKTATPNTNILAGGNFNGYTIQAVVGF